VQLSRVLIDDFAADPTRIIRHRRNAMHCAAESGDLAYIGMIAPINIVTSLRDCDGFPELYWASAFNHGKSAAALIDLMSNPFQRDKPGRTPFHVAATKDSPEVLQVILATNQEL
jgi:ankyrin repeat protein